MKAKHLVLGVILISSLSSAMGGNLRVSKLNADTVRPDTDQSVELVQYVPPREERVGILFLCVKVVLMILGRGNG